MPKFKIDLLQSTIYVSFAPTESEADAELKRIGGMKADNVPENNSCNGYVISAVRNVFIWVHPTANRRYVFHECYHACMGLMRGIGSDMEDEEVMAHVFEFMCEKVLTLWEKHQELSVNK